MCMCERKERREERTQDRLDRNEKQNTQEESVYLQENMRYKMQHYKESQVTLYEVGEGCFI